MSGREPGASPRAGVPDGTVVPMSSSRPSERGANLIDLLRHSGRSPLRHRIVFLHVPKCGGSSIGPAISRAYGLAGRAPGRRVHLAAPLTARLAEATGISVHRYRQLVMLYHLGLERTRFVTGHLHYTEEGPSDVLERWSFVTVLREPVARWFSAYFYDRFKSSDHARITLDLDEFLATDAARRFGDDYVRYLAPHELGPGDVSAADVTAAAGALERLALVGRLEDTPRFLADFEGRFGVRLSIPRRNASPAPEAMERARRDPLVRARVAELCRPNSAVYRTLLALQGAPVDEA